jgi:hypothetical protein
MSFNKLLETQIARLASSLPHPNGVDFPSLPATPVKENVKAIITRSGKTTIEAKTRSKKTAPIELSEEGSEAEAEVEAELRLEKEGKVSLKVVSDMHLLPFHLQMKNPVEDEKFSRFMDVIWEMYVNIPKLDTMQVPTYAIYLKDILNHKWAIPETDKLFIVEKCSTTILDGLLDKMGDPGILTISYLIGAQKFDQALCDLGASVSIMPKVIYDKLNHNPLVPTSMHLQLVDQSIWHLVRTAEDIPVKIKTSFIPMDFVILEMHVCR